MISIENLHKSFGGRTLFEGISFKINSKERAGLVGRNGHGKTTLFNIITGREEYDAGTIFMPRNYRMGYVQQHIDFTEDTVLKEGMKGLVEAEKDHHWKVEKVLAGLGFSTEDLARPPEVFSGGFQVRLNLAKVLVSEPDLLLLDEPTNYLDITSIRWIKRFLLTWPHELLLITHDRGFMDKVVTHTIGIHRKKTRKIKGDTEKYYTRIAQDETVYEKTRLNDEKREKEIQQFITRFRAKARLANMVQSRVKTLSKMKKKDKLEQIRSLDFSFINAPFKGRQVMAVENLSFSWGDKDPLFKNLSFTVNSGDRICVVGKNGKGKTTLLKLLAGKLKAETGKVQYNPQVVQGVFEQTNIKTLVDSRTVEEELLYSRPDVDRQLARNICGAMMFEGDAALKKIGVLSGGEKSRVMLGKLLVSPANILILDEPTNHLDMDACDALLAAIDNYEGTVIMVTHNELFLHALAHRLVVFEKENVRVFEDSYQAFLEKGGWGDEVGLEKKDGLGSSEAQQPVSKLKKKELRRLRSEVISEKSKKLRPVEHEIKVNEKLIEETEERLDRLNIDMVEATKKNDGGVIGELSRKIHSCQEIIEKAFEKMEELDEKRRIFEARFNEKIKEIS